MADNVAISAGSGTNVATDDIAGTHYQRVKLALGADGAAADAPVGGGVESGVLRVTIASDSTGLISVDDNGGSLTVDGSVSLAAALPAGTNNIGDVDVLSLPALPTGSNAIGKLAANSGVDIGDVDVTTCGTITPGTAATSLGKAEDAAHTSGDVGVMALGVRKDTAAALAGTDGDYQPAIYDANGRLHVVNSAGVGGDVAHDGADSGNPVKIGAVARTTNPTAVADGDRVNVAADKVGRLIVTPMAPRALIAKAATTISNTTETTILAAGGAGVYHDLTLLKITNQTNTAVSCTLRDDTAGTAVDIIDLAPLGGAVIPFPATFPQTADNDNWTLQLSAGSITVHVLVIAVKNN